MTGQELLEYLSGENVNRTKRVVFVDQEGNFHDINDATYYRGVIELETD